MITLVHWPLWPSSKYCSGQSAITLEYFGAPQCVAGLKFHLPASITAHSGTRPSPAPTRHATPFHCIDNLTRLIHMRHCHVAPYRAFLSVTVFVICHLIPPVTKCIRQLTNTQCRSFIRLAGWRCRRHSPSIGCPAVAAVPVCWRACSTTCSLEQ